MTKFYRECFTTDLLADEDINSLLDELCVDPDIAVNGDIIAIEFPFVTCEGKMDKAGAPSRVMVVKNGMAQCVDWFTLVTGGGLDQRQLNLLASIFYCVTQHWCDKLAVQMDHMDDGYGDPVNFDLLLASGVGVLLYKPTSQGHGMDPDFHKEDHTIQAYIKMHSAIALPPYGSSHARLTSVSAAEKGTKIAHFSAPLGHPTDFVEIFPTPRLP